MIDLTTLARVLLAVAVAALVFGLLYRGKSRDRIND
jgi:hypothetical protein